MEITETIRTTGKLGLTCPTEWEKVSTAIKPAFMSFSCCSSSCGRAVTLFPYLSIVPLRCAKCNNNSVSSMVAGACGRARLYHSRTDVDREGDCVLSTPQGLRGKNVK
ncbi:hypothetical protein PoB_007540600 [Plakobranchus ocellatus]|uniref:Uncharacterized protein n=1 Tax=Plakobranchus ocellatus TaxID=259542 RepID=A0AAV4DYI3_9GAST|nr:hypothetical protein PoB_007540600 [Plakobranchus ocellatus]